MNLKKMFAMILGGANTNVEDMEEGSSSEEDEDDEDAVRQPIGKPLMAVDAAPAVQQPPPALPTRENVEVRSYDPKAKEKVVPGKNKIDYNLNGVMKLPAFSHHISKVLPI